MNHLRLLGRKAVLKRPPLDRASGGEVSRDPSTASQTTVLVLVVPARAVDYAETDAGYALQAHALVYAEERLPAGSILELPDGSRYRIVGASAAVPVARVYEHKAVTA